MWTTAAAGVNGDDGRGGLDGGGMGRDEKEGEMGRGHER